MNPPPDMQPAGPAGDGAQRDGPQRDGSWQGQAPRAEVRHAQDGKDGKPKGRRLKPFIILGLVFLVIAALAFTYWLLTKGYATTDDAQIDGNIYQVSPRIAGQVAELLVDDNQHVQAGQLLVLIDPRDAQMALARAQAAEAQAQAELAVAQANQAQSVAQVITAQASLTQADQNYRRYANINKNAISQQQLDASTADQRTAQARLTAAQAQVHGSDASIASAQAAYAAAKVSADNATLQLSYTRLVAPAAGHIAQRTVRAGDVVAPGQGLMALVGDDVWVTANYKETQLAGIKRGAAATITVDAVPGKTFHGHVDSIAYGTGSVFSLLPAENATGNYVKIVQRVPVKILFDDPKDGPANHLAPGLSAEPSITRQK